MTLIADSTAGVDMDAALLNTVVIHRDKGTGKVTDISDGLATINMGVQVHVTSAQRSSLGHVGRLIMDRLSDTSNAMSWRIPLDALLDRAEWSMAPSPHRTRSIIDDIVEAQSNIIIPTNNPSRSHLVKAEMEESHSRFLYNELRYDPFLINIGYQLVNVVDWQLSWYLLRGSEAAWEYQNRIAALLTRVGTDGWSEVIVPEVMSPSVDRAVECLSVLAGILISRGDMEPVVAVSYMVDQVECRLLLHKQLISGFIRNRRTDNRKASNVVPASR